MRNKDRYFSTISIISNNINMYFINNYLVFKYVFLCRSQIILFLHHTKVYRINIRKRTLKCKTFFFYS